MVGGDTVRFPIVGGCPCFVFLGPPLKIAKLETKQWEEQQRTVSFVIIKFRSPKQGALVFSGDKDPIEL